MNNIEAIKIDSIQKIEGLLRNVISEVLSTKVGVGWMENEEHGLGKKGVDSLRKLIEKEKDLRHTVLVDYDLLSYTLTPDLKKIIEKEKNKDLFRAIFKDWEGFVYYLRKIVDLRNPAKHHRFLYPHEMLLLEAIAEEIEYYINSWHIGADFNIENYRFSFFEYVEVKGKENEQILNIASEKGKDWIRKIKEYLLNKGIKENGIRLKDDTFEGSISEGNIRAHWQTSSTPKSTSKINEVDCKSIFINLWCSPARSSELNELMSFVNKKYTILAFELDGKINIKKLKQIASDMAGLTPSSAGNHEFAEYSIMHFCQIGVRNTDREKGEISIQTSHDFLLKNAHNVISPGIILSYLTGNMPRRLLIALIKSSI